MRTKIAYRNGSIFTADDALPLAEAFVVEDGKITWVGKDQDLALEDVDEIVDLQNKTVIPGFVDAHMHPVTLAEYNQQISCLPPAINSIQELVAAIADRRKQQNESQWILGWGYDEGKFAEQRSPNRYDLDEGCSDAPVALTRTCLHIRCVNSKALEMAGITKDTPDPEGGEIDRDQNGEPTGVLRENARFLINDILPATSFAQHVTNVVDLGQVLLSQGVTSVAEMGLFDNTEAYPIYEEAAKKGFSQRVGLYYPWNFIDGQGGKELLKSIDWEHQSQQLQVKGLKLFGDGSISGRTAWVSTPYPGTDDYGMGNTTDEELEAAFAFAKEHHCQISMHAMGGRAIDRIVNRGAQEDDWVPGSIPSLRVEHVTEPTPEAIETARSHGFAFALQPIFQFCEIESYLANLGPSRTKETLPTKTMLNSGVQVCFSTDSPATSWATPSDPFPSLQSAVTRTAYDGTDFGQNQRIDIETALKLYTRESAKVCGFQGVGQITPGYAADFLVLSDDILTVAPEKIMNVHVEKTYIAGKKRYERK